MPIDVDAPPLGPRFHAHLDRWVESVAHDFFDRGLRPYRYAVAQVTPEGIRYMVAPGVFDPLPKLAWTGERSAACAMMIEGQDIIAKAHGQNAARIFWRGQRVIPLLDRGSVELDFPSEPV